MTESEWLSSSDPGAMLRHLTHEVHQASDAVGDHPRAVQPSERKLRLFACACCRQVWDGAVCEFCNGRGNFQTSNSCAQCPRCKNADGIGSGRIGGLTDPRSRRAVEVAERYADGLATEEDRERAWQDASDAGEDFDRAGEVESFQLAVMAQATVRKNIDGVLQARRSHVPPAVQASLLRDIWGNPFRPRKCECNYGCGVPCENCYNRRDWLAWNDGCVRKLAQSIYDDHRFADMPLLADALEEAGCEDAAILGHCRGMETVPCPNECRAVHGKTGTWLYEAAGPDSLWLRCNGPCGGTGRVAVSGPHVRGCWLLDLLTNRE